MTFYRQIMWRSWQITWRYKFLWFFGFFITFIWQGGAFELLIRNWQIISDRGTISLMVYYIFKTNHLGIGSVWQSLAQTNLGVISVVVLSLLAVIFLVIIYLAVNSLIALIRATFDIEKNKPVTFNSSRESIHSFGAVVGILFSAKALIWLFVALTGFLSIKIAFNNLHGWGFFSLYLTLFVLTCLVGFAAYFLSIFASSYVILSKVSFRSAVAESVRLFKSHWLICLEMAVSLFLLSILLTLVWLLAAFILLILFGAIFLALSYLSFTTLSLAILVILGIIVLLLLILTTAIFSTYSTVVWTLLFIRLVKEGGLSKLARVFGMGDD